MKESLTLSLIVLLVVMMPGLAIAGDYHSGTANTCSDCHTVHFSRSHDMAGGPGDESWVLGSSGPNEFLLKAPANELCLTCHDGVLGVPDVLGVDTNNLESNATAGGRSAGALNQNDNSTTEYPAYTGHSLGSTDVAPGGTWSDDIGLKCTNCHDQHGSVESYRNLRSAPTSQIITYAKETESKTGKDVYEEHGFGASLADHYGQNHIGLLEPNQTGSGVANFCKDCHMNFHGAYGGAEVGGGPSGAWLRHPNADSNIGSLGGDHSILTQYAEKLYRVRVMSATGIWGALGSAWTGAPADLTPTCLSCHKAHGNRNAFGLILASGTTAIDEDGDASDYRSLCGQCHTQAN